MPQQLDNWPQAFAPISDLLVDPVFFGRVDVNGHRSNFPLAPIRSRRPRPLSKQCILVDDNLGVAPCTDVAVIGPYPVDGFGCRLMAARAGNFDTLIVEQVVWPALRYFDRPPY
jgi:hypothetical protein